MKNKKLYSGLCLLLTLVFLLSSCADTIGGLSDESEIIGCVFDSDNGGLSEAQTEKKSCTVKYVNTDTVGGYIEGELEQTVEYGKRTKRVTARANEGYVFVGWSDGKTGALRVDGPVKSSFEVSPIFKPDGEKFSVTYIVSHAGRAIQVEKKTAYVGEKVTFTAQNPPFAYYFAGWDDGVTLLERTDTALVDGMTIRAEYKPICLDAPVISIITDDYGGVTSKTEYKNCKVSLENTNEEYCFEELEAEIRGRGNSTWGNPKKSYRIKFSEKRSMMGSDYEARSWTLIANYNDKSLSRCALAYEMAQSFKGLDFASMNEFVEVYLDGEYIGVYLLCDQIQVGEGRVDIGEEISENPEEMGFLIELDSRANEEGKEGYDYVVLGRDNNRCYLVKSPDSSDPAYDPDVHLKYISEYLDSCLEALSDQNWEKICELMDIDSFVDMYVVNEMFANLDYYLFSVYFYKAPNGKLFSGPAWDFDISSGNVNYGYAEGSSESGPRQDLIYNGKLWIADRNTWYRRLLRNEEFVELVRERLAYYKNDILNAANLADTNNPNGYYAKYGKAIERNFEKWKIMGKYIWPNSQVIVDIKTATGQMDYLSNWLRERYTVLCEVYQIEP